MAYGILVPQAGIEPAPPALEAQGLNHQITREIPDSWFLVLCYGGSGVKNPPADAGNMVSIPGSGSSPGEGNGNPLQYSCLGNPGDRGA